MRKLRLDRYTPQAANEVRTFIEDSLGERLAPGDVLESLKDGVALCKYDVSFGAWGIDGTVLSPADTLCSGS